MAMGEPEGARSSARADEQEPPYEGVPGRTRLKSIHVPLPNGFVRTIQVYDTVNVATDPHLKDPALAGALHRFETGEVLAIPFVYHDPNARKLALVVPETLRHEELRLRSKLLETFAEHTGVAIPSYARDATTVVGVEALKAYLSSPHANVALGEVVQRETAVGEREGVAAQREALVTQREAALDERKQNLEIQADALGQREERLHHRAEEVTRREDELRTYREELEAMRADLAMREQELESRLEIVRQREDELGQRIDSTSVQLTASAPASTASGQVDVEDVVQVVDDDMEEMEEVQELDELEPLETNPGQPRPRDELAAAVQLVPDAAEVLDAADDVEEIVDDVEELEEIEPVGEVTGVHADLGTDEHDHRIRESKTVVSSEHIMPRSEPPPPPTGAPNPSKPPPPIPSVPPPGGFFERRIGAEGKAVAEAGSVRMFVKLPEGKEDCFSEGSTADLLAQLVVVEECPIVLLTLIEQTENRPTVVRAVLDPRAAEDREVLENLRRKFDARIGIFDAKGTYLRALEVAGPREVNVARILERVSKMRTAAAVDVSTAMERVLSAPPPVKAKDHPFVGADALPTPKSAAEAAKQLEALATWSSHDKMDHALLVLSIPRDLVDGTVRAISQHAVAYGLPLPGRLAERAISLGVATDAASLVGTQLAAFAKTTAAADRGGLSPEQVADGWERLLKDAADNEVAIETDVHEQAWKAIRQVRGGNDGLAEIDPAKLPDMGVPELMMLLEHPRYRRDAAVELANRKDADLADALCKAARKMPRAEVVRVVPRIVGLGDGTGDALIDGLSARKTFVRQAFALALGELKLRRAVVPLVHLLSAEESDVWKEIARVVGSFGTASLRNVQRALKDPKGQEERYILTLAHLANHGCDKQVEKLRSDDKPAIATMASEALTLREHARSIDEGVRAQRDLASNDPILKLSRRFYEELEGKAPDQDLEDG